MAAMRSGASGTDDYLEDWRRGEPQSVGGDLQQAVDACAADLEATYDDAALKALIDAGGHKLQSATNVEA